MVKFISTSLLLSALSWVALGNFAQPAQAQAGPRVIQRSVILNLSDHGRYWPDPKKEPVYGKAAWTPNNLNLNFLVEGPLAAGSQLSMEFSRPDGKPWISVNCRTPELAAGELDEIKCEDIDEHKALPLTGKFKVAIRLKNALAGQNSILYQGSFKVGTYTAKYQKQTAHYIDEDWRVPLAFVAIDAAQDENFPPLISYFWFKHRDISSGDLTAFLFYQGKQIAISTDNNSSANLIIDRDANLEPLDPKQDYSYQYWSFYFTKVRGYAQNASNYDLSVWHLLSQNPGPYQIKVLHKGKLVRTAHFNVGADGRIMAPGLVEKDGGGNARILIPTQVSGAVDAPWDKKTFQTEVFYGNATPQTAGIMSIGE